jgi:hypothetical protein
MFGNKNSVLSLISVAFCAANLDTSFTGVIDHNINTLEVYALNSGRFITLMGPNYAL